MPTKLAERRDQVVTEWQHCVGAGKLRRSSSAPSCISPQILSSWLRSQTEATASTRPVPLADPLWIDEQWRVSLIRQHSQPELAKLADLVAESDMVAAIANPAGQLLWTTASRHMETKAADEHFIPGGHWREQTAGTNAVGLSAATRSAVTVFSAEHYRASLQDWVCYAAPIIHPHSGQLLGVLDLSTTWDHYTPLGQSAVAGLATDIAKRLPANLLSQASAALELNLLGQPSILLHGQPTKFSLRHSEILCLLALHPEGLSADRLHHALYGDAPITKATLKSELSTLRQRLNGLISSRPYKLELTVKADFIELWKQLSQQRLDLALQYYRGALLTDSNSPMIESWRYSIEALISRHLDQCSDLLTLIDDPTLGIATQVRERIISMLAAS